MRRGFLIILALCFVQLGLFAQGYIHLTTNDGLPDNHARFIYQDNNGYIFIGSRNGLSMYDGYTFSIAEGGENTGLYPKEFSAMMETSRGTFVSSSSGIYKYDLYTNELVLQKELKLLDEACFIEYRGHILCGNSDGLYEYDIEGLTWRKANHYFSFIENVHIRDMLIGENGQLYIVGSKGMFILNEAMQLEASYTGVDKDYYNINGILQSGSNEFWISTVTNFYSIDTLMAVKKDYVQRFRGKHIRCLEEDLYGRIWLGGEFGLVIYDIETGSFVEESRDLSDSQGLNDNAVYALLNDRNSNMWIGTYFGGVNIWSRDFEKFSVLQAGKSRNRMSGKVVRNMQEDERGNLWLALEDGGLNYYDLEREVLEHFFVSDEAYRNVHSIILIGDMLWMGSFNNGIEAYKVDYIQGLPALMKAFSCLEGEMIFDMTLEYANVIYAGTSGGIIKLNTKTYEWEKILQEEFDSRFIYTIEFVGDGILLAGTLRNGLYEVNTENRLTSSFSGMEEFQNMQTISFIGRKENGLILLTASDGLYAYYVDSKTLKLIHRNSGINEYRSVLAEDSLHYWIATTNGLLYYDRQEEGFSKYSKYDGLPENQFNFNAAYCSMNGAYYFGTYNGLVSFFPEHLKQQGKSNREVSIVSYTLSGRDGNAMETHFLDCSQGEIRLESYQKYVSLDFSTLGYLQNEEIQYEVRLNDKNALWDLLSNTRSLTLSGLGRGWHYLEVRAKPEGNELAPISTISIYRKPAIWQTNFAIVVYFLGMGFILLLIRRRYLNRQEEKNAFVRERFEKESQEKLNENKMRFFLNMSHEFRTPLTIIGGTIGNILNKYEVERDFFKKLNTIKETSEKLNNMVNHFLDYGKMDLGLKPVELKKADILDYSRKACNMFDNWAEINQLKYTKEIDEGVCVCYFDPFKVERVIYNLLSNAFKFNHSQGSVRIQVHVDPDDADCLLIIVRDTGSGIDEESLEKLRLTFNNPDNSVVEERGIGLSYTAMIVSQMSGQISVESKVSKGSHFLVKLPIQRKESFSSIQEKDILIDEISVLEEKICVDVADAGSTNSILIIDDNSDLLTMLRESLEGSYKITIESNPIEAIELAKKKEFSIIICDIMMPEMNGFEVIEKLHADIRTSHIPVLVLTAAAEKEVELAGYRKGAVSYLSKPFELEELRLKVNSVLSFREEIIAYFSSSERFVPSDIAHTKTDEDFIERAKDIVYRNLQNQRFSVDVFCREMSVSRSLLHTKLKSITGYNTTEFIRNIRLQQANIMLRKTGDSVSEVAYKCGFNDPSYFSKCFTKKYGISPSKY